ncbi:MAG: hypothetical protein KME16_05200 [Scytolyngbya sp. HA4215-MV1]|nr:hypothetical protein [Scytolyngbya sp. HA4215-MV1]
MTVISPQAVYANLQFLDQEDAVKNASYRELAQEILANPEVSLSWRQAIADRLNDANRLLARLTVTRDDSY